MQYRLKKLPVLSLEKHETIVLRVRAWPHWGQGRQVKLLQDTICIGAAYPCLTLG